MDQEIHFCTASDGARIAYAITGEGPPLVKAANWLGHLEFERESPVWRHWLVGLSRDHRLIRYDERGCGLSDWDVPNFGFDAWVEDLETVVDALELERFALLGLSQGSSVAIAYAIRHPERVSHLVLYGGYARGWDRRDNPDTHAEYEALISLTETGWGRQNPAYRQVFTSRFIPEADSEQVEWFNQLQSICTSKENAVRFIRTFADIDVVDLLPRIKVPTLVVHVREDAVVDFEESRILAAAIPDARFVALEGRNHLFLADEPAWPAFLTEVRKFLDVPEPEVSVEEVSAWTTGERPAGVASDTAPGAADGEHATPTGALGRVRDRKLVQWALTYLAAAWIILQLLDVVAEPWNLPAWAARSLQALLGFGLLGVVILAWYHGEKGRQRVSGPELVIIAILLLIAGVVLSVIVP